MDNFEVNILVPSISSISVRVCRIYSADGNRSRKDIGNDFNDVTTMFELKVES